MAAADAAFEAFCADDWLPPLADEDFQMDDLFSTELLTLLQQTGSTEAPSGEPGIVLQGSCPSLEAPERQASPVPTPPSAPASPQPSPAPAPAPKRAASSTTGGVEPALQLRQVTTQLFGAPSASASAQLAALTAAVPALLGLPPRPSCSGSGSDSEDSDDTAGSDGHSAQQLLQQAKPNKRKAPEVDWRKIEDPAERRRQRRLAKNRVTAARSRERKKSQWADMEARMKSIETENGQLRALLEQFARENTALKEQLMNLTRAGGAKRMCLNLDRSSTTTEPAALAAILIATLLVLCCFLPGEKAMLLGSAVPLLLLVRLLQQQQMQPKDGAAIFDALFRFIAQLKVLVSKSSRGFKRYVDSMLFKRHVHCSRMVTAGIGKAAQALDVDALSAHLAPPPADPGQPLSQQPSDADVLLPDDVLVPAAPAGLCGISSVRLFDPLLIKVEPAC